MNPWKRLLFFLVLNIIVSAGTTVAVMSWWERAHLNSRSVIVNPTQQAGQTETTANPVSATAGPTATPLPPNDVPLIRVENVFGIGDLQNEVVLLKRIGEGELWLTGWRLEDESGQKYIFPELLLNKDGAVQIFTRPGVDSVIELHWGMKASVWQPGELVTLVDPQGNVRATYRIP